MILIIDNYDSFTFNLVQYMGELGADLRVRRNDRVTVDEVKAMAPRGLVISPGPGRPEDSGISVALVREFAPSIPMLGVCLGHQAIGQAFGGQIVAAPELMHGKTSRIRYSGNGIFDGLPNPFIATRYHSLVVARDSFPDELQVTASAEDEVIMGLQHREYPVYGVQFHPESILTVEGKRLLGNFIELCKPGAVKPKC